MPWKNGGGTTRELLAWPTPADWIVRVSVADISASGPFSMFEGVDRWFAVLNGGDVALSTQGLAPRRLAASLDELHAFPGDAPTQCEAFGAATQDFNIMLRRARGTLRQSPLRQRPSLESSHGLVAVFAASPVTVRVGDGPACELGAMSLAWWRNAGRAPLRWRAHGAVRGWWLEASATG